MRERDLYWYKNYSAGLLLPFTLSIGIPNDHNNNNMRTAEALTLAQTADPAIVSVSSQTKITSLWAGMGWIVCLKCQRSNGDTRTIIAKHIKCSNPQSFGDRRKAASYRVEATFYASDYCKDLANFGICCQGLHTEDDGNGDITILMDPLPNPTIHNMVGDVAKAAVRSVARLHSYFWGNTKANAAVEDGLAAQGTYWYLDTRPDEYESMNTTTGLSRRLKKAAHPIDRALKAHQYQTICHGDLKACNMSLSANPSYVTLVDFQYMGKACPAKDLAYLFCCGLDVDDDFEERQESELLQLYIDELNANGVGKDIMAPLPTLEGLKVAMDLAYCDLYRWMLGWGIWGNSFLPDRVEKAFSDGIVDKFCNCK
jgi:Ecdysteroid kinase-like family